MSEYRYLRGDLDAKPEILSRLNRLAQRAGEIFTVTSGNRTDAEQLGLWNRRSSNPYPVAKPKSLGGSGSNHTGGDAADVTVNGRPIQDVYSPAQLRAAGLVPLAGDAVHVELPKSDRGGGGLGATLNNAGPIGQGINLGASVAGDVLGLGGDKAADLAGDVAGKAVGLVVDAVGENGARIALYGALVLAGVALVAVGLGRTLGISDKAAKLAGVAATATPAGRGAKAAGAMKGAKVK